MATLFVRHEVKDYAHWKGGYDEFAHVRKEVGVTAASVHRDPENPNVVIVTHRFSSADAMFAFINSEDLKGAMAEAGVVGQPEIWLSEDVEHTDF